MTAETAGVRLPLGLDVTAETAGVRLPLGLDVTAETAGVRLPLGLDVTAETAGARLPLGLDVTAETAGARLPLGLDVTAETAGARLPLGLIEYLDLAPGRSAEDKRRKAFAGAVLADELGYSRVWVPEHHGVGSPSVSPLPTVAVIGSHTTRIRVGTAVTLLRLRDVALTAEDIATAETFCPGRLDVGLGRGGPTGPAENALRHLVRDDDSLDLALRELIAITASGSDLVDGLGAGCEVWLHGGGTRSARLAAELGANYCHGLFLNPDLDTCLRALDEYRAAGTGTTAVAVAVAVNDDQATASADAAAQPFAAVAGDADRCAETVVNVHSLTGADEVVVAEVSATAADHLHALGALREQVTAATTATGKGVTS